MDNRFLGLESVILLQHYDLYRIPRRQAARSGRDIDKAVAVHGCVKKSL